ncbi:hypothetical protein [Halalkalibacter krulwichiae]|uniref:Serine/threonine protein kinase n=1 Tax=Halalkalibacter krulwichiae TaxID=199441 RepID=A0A1X9M5X6_9BACI|nr:hypothetical protein [Halalkalibacter krulwichiae]ARK28848.1 hypothetical protein BkAM31D_02690 [Halalkalibacter krulwichiae]
MNCKEIKNLVEDIEVQNFEDEDVSVINNSSLEMIGKGRQGAVFKINDEMCMKVYGDVDDCEREYYAMSLGQHTSLLPKIYCKGENFIVMEMVYGVDLREYMQSQPLTEKLSHELIRMLITFKEIGYERIDHHKRQIYLQDDGSLKVIDVGRTVWRNRTYPYPRKLLQSLGNEYRAMFIEHVKVVAPELYEEWDYYIQMEGISAKLYGVIENKEQADLEQLKEDTNKLLSTKDPDMHYKGLLNLIRKVVKEQRKRELEKQNKGKGKKKGKKQKKK